MAYTLYKTLHATGLYETLCFLGTTETTHVFLQDDRPRFRNRRIYSYSEDHSDLWRVGLIFNV